MAIRKLRHSWYVDIRAEYKRYRIRSPENTKAGAEAYEALLRHKLARGESIDKSVQMPGQEQSLVSFASKWFDEYVVSNNKPSEQRAKRYILWASLLPFFGKMSIGQIGVQHIEQYKAHIARKGISNKTINNRLTVLKKCLAAAYEWLQLEGTPPKITWLRCAPPKTDYLTEEESMQLLEHADGVVREMILTALQTGMRQGELKGLQWSSVNWHNRTLTVRHSRCDYSKELGSTKSNRERSIPMTDDVYKMLFARKKDAGYVFLDAGKHIFDEQRLRLRLNNVCKKAEVRHIGWHTLRHTFASHLAMRGASMRAIQIFMGHSSLKMTERYTHIAPSALRETIELLNSKQVVIASFGQLVGN